MSKSKAPFSTKAMYNAQLLCDSVQRILQTDAPTLKSKQREALYAMQQKSAKDIAHSYFKLPTGFGKTVMFTMIARAYINSLTAHEQTYNKVIILVPRLILSEQTVEKLNEFGDIRGAQFNCQVSAQDKAKCIHENVIVSTYNSMDKLIESVGIENVGLIIADEAHHILGPNKIKELIKLGRHTPIIGFTATPAYKEEHHIESVLPTEIYSMTIKQGVQSNMLCPVKNILYRTSVVCDASKIRSKSNGDFDYDEISSKIKTNILVDEIAEIYINGGDNGRKFYGMRTIINCPNIDIAEKQAARINEMAGKNIAITIHSKIKKFHQLKSDFLTGKFCVACQVNTMTEGFDDPTVNMCINYPSRSAVKIEQASGRALRVDETNPDKVAYVLDTVFRSSADEHVSEMLIGAKHAGQVLFSDIADGFLLVPDFIDEHLTPNVAAFAHMKNSAETPFANFDVITDATQLMEIHNTYVKACNANKIATKTPHWKNPNELHNILIGNEAKIRKALYAWRTKLPHIIQEKTSGNRLVLCLDINHVQEFAEQAGFRLQNLAHKTDKWYTAEQLAGILLGKPSIISKHIRNYRHQMPDAAIQEMHCGRTIGLCMHADYIDEFCRLSKLKRRTAQKKTDDWKSVAELTDFFKASRATILGALRKLQKQMPDAIQEKQINANITLCLRADYINEFATLSELCVRNLTLTERTPDWMTQTELRNVYACRAEKIAEQMEMLATVMPYAIQQKIAGKKATPWCLHVDYIEEFTMRSGLPTRYVSLKPKTPQWFNAADLYKIVFTDTTTINKLIEQYSIEHPYAVERKQNGSRTPLCVHENYINEFIQNFKLRRR